MSLTINKINKNCRKVATIQNKQSGNNTPVYIDMEKIDTQKKETLQKINIDTNKYDVEYNFEKIENQNYRIAISSPSGGGKSYCTNKILINLCKNNIIPKPIYLEYSKEEIELYDLKDKYILDEFGGRVQDSTNLQGTIFLFTNLIDDDKAYEIEKYEGRIFKKLIISEEVTTIQLEELKNCICVFDDVETYHNTKLIKNTYNFINGILTQGRKLNINIIYCSHNLKQYKLTSYINLEMTHNVFFPKYTSETQLATYIKTYMGLDKKDIELVKQSQGRNILVSRTVPRYLISNDKIYLF
jgi:hypothetical protein